MKLDCSVSNLSLKVLCETSHLCWCTVSLKDVHIFVSDVPSSFDESRRVAEGSGGEYIPVASICKCRGGLLVRLILHI